MYIPLKLTFHAALSVSLKMERHIEDLVAAGGKRDASDTSSVRSFGRQYQQIIDDDEIPDGREETLEEKALGMAIQEVYHASGDKYCPWAGACLRSLSFFSGRCSSWL